MRIFAWFAILSVLGCARRSENSSRFSEAQEGIGGDLAALTLMHWADEAIYSMENSSFLSAEEASSARLTLYAQPVFSEDAPVEGPIARHTKHGLIVNWRRLAALTPQESVEEFLTIAGAPEVCLISLNGLYDDLLFTKTTDAPPSQWFERLASALVKYPVATWSGSKRWRFRNTVQDPEATIGSFRTSDVRIQLVRGPLYDSISHLRVDAIAKRSTREILVDINRIGRIASLNRYTLLLLVHEMFNLHSENLQADRKYQLSSQLFFYFLPRLK